MKLEKSTKHIEKATAERKNIAEDTMRDLDLAAEKGASGWLCVLPFKDQGFTLNKAEFRDSLVLRYGEPILNFQSTCPCGENFDINHTLNCRR